MHSIATQDNIIQIKQNNFFVPKVVICVLLLVYLLTMRLYMYVQYAQDPFFDSINGLHVNYAYGYIYSAGIVILGLFVFYFLMILY